MTPSRNQVSKAGRLLRRIYQGEGLISPERIKSALEVLTQYRASHSLPLTKANNGLRSMMATEGIEGRPTQRLKRIPTIIGKLIRHPNMALPNMQDIAGCRVVCSDLAELRRLEARIRRNRPPSKVYDYVHAPKPSGYRAVHLVVSYDSRLIEIQLRTQSMHAWASLQESVGALLGIELKSGIGPPEVLEYMMLLSQALEGMEKSEPPDPKLPEQVKTASDLFVSYLKSRLLETGQLPGV